MITGKTRYICCSEPNFAGHQDKTLKIHETGTLSEKPMEYDI
jgi:hypothetical protein